MQDYKSLRTAVVIMICASLVNTQTHTPTRHLFTGCQLSQKHTDWSLVFFRPCGLHTWLSEVFAEPPAPIGQR